MDPKKWYLGSDIQRDPSLQTSLKGAMVVGCMPSMEITTTTDMLSKSPMMTTLKMGAPKFWHTNVFNYGRYYGTGFEVFAYMPKILATSKELDFPIAIFVGMIRLPTAEELDRWGDENQDWEMGDVEIIDTKKELYLAILRHRDIIHEYYMKQTKESL